MNNVWPMKSLYELLAQVAEAFERLHIPYLVTGSVASMAYGEPRLTNDIDVVAGINDQHVAGLLAAFPADAFYLSEEARDGERPDPVTRMLNAED